ncbi:replication protein A 70 kDa DNA-binding subunit A-like [Impatiens glandulifera]|uniref:replication protein A 70 kDa DNA-binding subunit A-like n=1 Tax=Impatiens glandulifera TaxID=253017 RepID=UPI001FB07A90|nr:replication protein A 70 kDa DNA-binding subunit A-like [Impatiens glandulifera]
MKSVSEILNIPRYKFNFSDYKEVISRSDNCSQLTVIIARLISLGSKTFSKTGYNTVAKRGLNLQFYSGEDINLTLWGNIAENFEFVEGSNNQDPIVIVVTGLLVKLYQDMDCHHVLSSTTATQVFQNLMIPEVVTMRERFAVHPSQVCLLDDIVESSMSLQDEMMKDRHTIEELYNLLSNEESKECIRTVEATINNVCNYNGWFYYSCDDCRGKVTLEGDVFFCNSCVKVTKYPTPRYKLEIEVGHESGAALFVLFDRVVNKLVNLTVSDLLQLHPSCDKDLPLPLSSMSSRKLVFQDKITDYNLKKKSHNFTIIKVFDPSQSLITQQIKMRELLKQQGVWAPLSKEKAEIVAGPAKESTSGKITTELEAFEEKAHSTILLYLADEVITEVSDEDTVIGLWSKLEALYMTQSLTNKFLLKQHMFSLRMLKDSVTLKKVRSALHTRELRHKASGEIVDSQEFGLIVTIVNYKGSGK